MASASLRVNTTVMDRVSGLLIRTKTWLTTDQVAERLGAQPKYVHMRLMSLAAVGDVERRIAGRAIEWRAVRAGQLYPQA